MTTNILVPAFKELIAQDNVSALREFCESEHPTSVAESLSELTPEEIWQVIRHVSPEKQAEIVDHLDDDVQLETITTLGRLDAAAILANMPSDDRAELYRRLTEEQQQWLNPALSRVEREDIGRLTSYPEESAGAAMSSDYVALRKDMTTSDAIRQIRKDASRKETVYYAYVVDDLGALIGFVSLKNLIMAEADACIEDVMNTDVIFANAHDDRETVAREIQKYDLIAIPIVNGGNTLVGIITHDDAMDIITSEQQEDLEKLMAIRGQHKSGAYLKTSFWVHFRNRMPWVVGLAALGLLSGMVIHSFEDAIMSLMILALYMPMVADTGGNTGSQAATVIVRALALGDVKPGDALKVFAKEFGVAILLAIILAILSFGKVLFLSHGVDLPEGFTLVGIGSVIGLALGLQVISATMIGAALPLVAQVLGKDPAIVASPAITTTVDVTGLLLYFTTARILLGI